MYTETIESKNKIITYDDLYEIIYKMHEKLEYYLKVYENEKIANEKIANDYQKWTFKNDNSRLFFSFSLKDGTSFDIDNYYDFMKVFNERLEEITYFSASIHLTYNKTLEKGEEKYYFQHIRLDVYERHLQIDSSLASDDNILDDLYFLISDKIYNAKERYDDVIKKRGLYTNIVGFPIGFVFGIIIAIGLSFVPLVKDIYIKSYVGFPIITLIISFVFGNIIGGLSLNKLYEKIAPERVYDSYDMNRNVSIYKDNIKEYTNESEILIGKNTHNLEARNKKDRMKKIILIEIPILIVASLVIIMI